jgi:hypothetical protein
MWSSERAAVLGLVLVASAANAQQAAQGFAVERFYPSAAGGGWFVMDELAMRGGFGGALSVTTGYARNPVQVGGLGVVSSESVLDFGAAVTWERWRLYLNVDTPLTIQGHSGEVGTYSYTAPGVTLGSNPDTVSDPRLGVDVRLLGGPDSSFRLGLGAQLFVPNGVRSDYDTDGTWRAMFRVLVAGSLGPYTCAAQLGVHVRPLDDGPTPGSPNGSELLFGAAGGRAFALSAPWRVVLGPEVWGETALRTGTTGVEAMFSVRLEGTGPGAQLRVKLGAGGGLDAQLGTPQGRLLLGVEYFNPGA